jgi:hypothetical protein
VLDPSAVAAVAKDAVATAGPERAAAIDEQREGQIRNDAVRRPRIKHRELSPVEACDSLLRRDPEVAVGGLGDAMDGVLRDPFVLVLL